MFRHFIKLAIWLGVAVIAYGDDSTKSLSLVEHWKKSNFNIEIMEEYYLNDDFCYGSRRNLIACLYGLHRMMRKEGRRFVLAPKKGLPDKIQKKIGKRVFSVGDTEAVEFLPEGGANPTGNETKRNRLALQNLITFWSSSDRWKSTKEKRPISFKEIIKVIRESFKTEHSSVMAGNALNGVVAILYDHFSSMVPESYHRQWVAEKSGGTNNYGLVFNPYKFNQAQVVSAFGSSQNKIQEGDIVTAVDHVDVKGLSLNKVVNKLIKHKKERITLSLKRGKKNLEVELPQKRVAIPHLQGRVLGVNEGVGYIKLNTFNRKTCSDFVKQIDKFKKDSISDLIIDLRGNHGGTFVACHCLIGVLLGKDIPIVYGQLIDKSLKKMQDDKLLGKFRWQGLVKTDRKKIFEGNVVVLINEDSASASEQFANVLAQHKRAYLIGVRSFGKGTGQLRMKLPLFPHGLLFKTTFRFTNPDQTQSLHLHGVAPHFEVKQPGFEEGARVSDLALNPGTPLGKAEKFSVPGKLQSCMEKNKTFRNEFGHEGVESFWDYQLLAAMDLTGCLD